MCRLILQYNGANGALLQEQAAEVLIRNKLLQVDNIYRLKYITNNQVF